MASEPTGQDAGVINGNRVLWVTGAGSGIGRAAAVAAAGRGWRVALSGRRADALEETARLVAEVGGESLTLPLDALNPTEVFAAQQRIRTTWDQVTDLLLAAGLNAPQRSWSDQTLETFERIVATNLTAVARMIDTVLPGMRARGYGQIVVVSSYSAWRFSPHAGVAYSASKTALAAICQSVNAQVAEHGIRACHLCPGDVDTDFLELRPEVPDAKRRQVMLSPEDVAAAILYVLDVPAHVRIDELVISPVSQA
jgi:NADP-dependent 3-hydroxy acid dehydrogenase YdfG